MDSDRLNIMILAAGAGERLRPITEHIPKPLVPFLGEPVLQHVLNALSGISFDRIGVNLHYKREVMEEWISRIALRDRIVLFPEESILGTGGALQNAEHFLNKGPFLVHNADILSDIDLDALLEHHRCCNNLVTLAVHDFDQFNNITVDKKGVLTGAGSLAAEGEKRAFTGIAVYGPQFLQFLPRGKSSVVDGWMNAIGAGQKVGTLDVTGSYWTDIGTPASYAAAVFTKLRNDGESLYIHPSTSNCYELDIRGHVVIEEGALCSAPATLKNCIILPGARFDTRSPSVQNCIAGPDFIIPLNEADIVCIQEGGHLIGTGGSDRSYFRINDDGSTAVLMQCLQDDADFERHIQSTAFFLEHAVPVPKLTRYDPVKKGAIFQDAGDLSLYSWLKCPRDANAIAALYKKVIDGLLRIHQTGTCVKDVSFFGERAFDPAYFRWESDYFIERFIKGLSLCTIQNMDEIDQELNALAQLAASFPRTLLHRDFQSQNVMIVNKENILIIDFQGARMGPPAYDVASLLWDPYYHLSDSVRNDLLHYYLDRAAAAEADFDQDAFMKSLLPCRMQRHMQALGAYGYLSSVKGKKYFMKFVPEGVRLLKGDLAEAGGAYPSLRALAEKL